MLRTHLKVFVCMCICVCPLNQLTSFHEVLYERYSTADDASAVIFTFLRSVVTAWRTRALEQWERHS